MKISSKNDTVIKNLELLSENFMLFDGVDEIEVIKGARGAVLRKGKLVVSSDDERNIYPLIAKALCFGNASEGETLFNRFGVMLDCARNGVPKVEALKKFIPLISLMGYNYLELYTEDCMEVEGEEQLGYGRGKISIAEFKELDEFSHSFGVELVPCIQTLAHLSRIFLHYKEYASVIRDKGDVLLVGEERTYTFIENIIKTCRKAFSSSRINIGMDEAFELGMGKYFALHGYESKESIMRKHLPRVVDICKKYGFKPALWGDMFYRGRESVDTQSVPSEATLIYWNYLDDKPEPYHKILDGLKNSNLNYGFAGAVHKWYGFAPLNEYSEHILSVQAELLPKYSVSDFKMTAWGDNGAECSFFSILPSLSFMAEKNFKVDGFCSKFLKLATGYDHDEWLALDRANKLFDRKMDKRLNPSKYLLYADALKGMEEFEGREDYTVRYRKSARALLNLSKKQSPFAYLFKVQSLLCKVLEEKCVLTERIREAYKTGERARLERIARFTIPSIVRKLKTFTKAFIEQWNSENRPEGLEVQEYRLYGLIGRLGRVKERILRYLSGADKTIPELDETPLYLHSAPEGYNGCTLYNGFIETVTYNTF